MTGGAVLQHRMYNLINPNLSDVTWSYSFPTSLFCLGEKGQFRISKPTLKDFTIVPLAGVQTMQAGKNVQLSSVNSTGYSSEVPQTNQPMSSAAFNYEQTKYPLPCPLPLSSPAFSSPSSVPWNTSDLWGIVLVAAVLVEGSKRTWEEADSKFKAYSDIPPRPQIAIFQPGRICTFPAFCMENLALGTGSQRVVSCCFLFSFQWLF